MCDRDEFERKFPVPKNVIWCGNGYAPTEYSADQGYNRMWKVWQTARAQTPNLSRIAQKKLAQMGATVHGVLVKNEAGAWVAVSDAGRVMWLDDFEGQAARAQGGEAVAEAHMAGQADAGVDPSYSNAKAYADVHPSASVSEDDPIIQDYARCLHLLGVRLDADDDLPVCLGDMLDELLATTPQPADRCAHGIRHPHPCRECEDREPPEGAE